MPTYPSKLEAFVNELDALRHARDRQLIFLVDGPPITVAVADVVYATAEKKGIAITLADGRVLLTRPSDSLQGLSARLAAHPNFVRVQNGRLLNLDYVETAVRVDSDEHRLTLHDGRPIPLTMNQDAVMAYFQVESLDHVTPWSERQAYIEQEGLRRFEQDIRFMDEATIRANFSQKAPPDLIRRQLVGNIIWQAYNWIREGKLEPLDGNIRSFWYSHVKSVLLRFFEPKKRDQYYKELTDILANYVGEGHLFRYADMGLVDDSGTSWSVGETHPQIILAAEKNGHWRAMLEIQRETGVTAIALGGQPSLMTTEGLVDALSAKGVDLDRPFHLVTDVDYDPSGNIVAEAFRRQLRQMGVEGHVTRLDLIQPENFTAEEIKAFRYPVPDDTPEDKKRNAKWLDKKQSPFGGGLPGPDGKPVAEGLESDTLPRKRLHELALIAIDEVKKAPPEENWTELRARVARRRPPLQNTWGPHLLPE